MACKINIKENLINAVESYIPSDYTSKSPTALKNIEKTVKKFYGYDLLYFRPVSGDTFIKTINIPEKLINSIYEQELAIEREQAIKDREKFAIEANEKINEEGDVYFQEENERVINKKLSDKVQQFLTNIGVTTINVDTLRDSEGNPMKGVAMADMMLNIIEVVKGKADVSTLAEEASHFFVEMLTDSKMLDNMMNKITNYQVYQDVINNPFYQSQYKGDETKLRKEAIGKLITQHIIGKVPIENKSQEEFANKWWNVVWNKIKSLFNKANTDEFKQAAIDILKGNTTKLDVNKKSTGKFYQDTNKQEEIINNLDNKFNISYNEDALNEKTNKKGIYELNTEEGLKKIFNRVSDRVSKYMEKKGFAERTEKQKKEDEVRRLEGVKGHNDINNIITRLVEGYSGVTTTQRVASLNDNYYNKLEVYFKEFLESFPPGTKFYTEKIIYDEASNEAGTIDFMAVLPDGKVDIYDWKFVEFKNKDANGKIISKSVPWYKEEAYNIQLTRYRNILKYNYGIDKFGKTRVIPISAEYRNNKLTNIAIGNQKIDDIDRPYLDPVPIRGLAGGAVELTGDERLDNMIKVLIQRRDLLTKKSETTPEGKLKKAERLARIDASIKEIQINKDIKEFLDDAIFELKYITNIGIENLSLEDLVKAKELIDYYSDLKKNDIISLEHAKKHLEAFNKVTNNSQELYSRINKEYEKRIKEEASKRGQDDIFKAQKEDGFLSRLFRTISQSNHPIIKTFYKLVMESKDKTYNKVEELNKNIESSLRKLEEWGSSKGLKGTDIFKNILQFNEDGKWTGNLISKWSKKFYELRDAAIKNRDADWLSENTIFNKEAYKERLESNIKIWKQMYDDTVDGEDKINKRILDFNQKYNVEQYNSAYFNKKNYFLKPTTVWQSEEIRELNKPENAPLKEFYDLFLNTIDEFRDFLPLDINGNFIPNIKNDLMDQIAQNGMSSIRGLGNSIIDHLDAKSDSTIGMVDEITGERIKEIPLLYINKIDSSSKSQDLGKVLSIFAEMAYNYKHMSEIEASSIILRDVLSSTKQILTTSNGKETISKVTGETAEVMQSSETLEQFNSYMDYYLYGIKTKNKDATFKFFGRELSGIKTFSKAMSYFSTKSLAGNLVSGLANGIGGVSNAFFEGVKGRFYNNTHYRKSLAMMSSANTMAYASMEFWDIDSSNTSFKKANNLSVSSISKNLTMDKFYFLQRGGDFTVENSVLLAMLQSHTLKDGKIVKASKEDKSLFEMSEVKDDKLFIEGLSEEEFHNFRRKVKYLYGTMKGNTNNDDINNIKLTVLGQGLMQFRNWIPRMADERFGNLRFTGDLETWEEGKYRTFWSHTVNKQIIPNLFKTLVNGGVLGFGAGINSKSIELKAKELYLKEVEKNPNLTITEAEFIELHKSNMKSAALELQLILTIIGLLAFLKPEPDDKKDSLRMAMVKILNRNLDEVSFFINPSSTTSILKKPVPILGLATDVVAFVSDFTGEVTGQVIGNQKMIDKNKPVRRFNKLFPIGNALEGLWSLTDPDYNKTKRSKKK